MKWPSASFSSTWRCLIPMSSHNALRVKKSRRNCVLKSRGFYLPNGDFLIFTKTSFRFVSCLVRFVCSLHFSRKCQNEFVFFFADNQKVLPTPKSEEWKASNVYYNEASTTTEIKPLLTVLKSRINHLIQYTQGNLQFSVLLLKHLILGWLINYSTRRLSICPIWTDWNPWNNVLITKAYEFVLVVLQLDNP